MSCHLDKDTLRKMKNPINIDCTNWLIKGNWTMLEHNAVYTILLLPFHLVFIFFYSMFPIKHCCLYLVLTLVIQMKQDKHSCSIIFVMFYSLKHDWCVIVLYIGYFKWYIYKSFDLAGILVNYVFLFVNNIIKFVFSSLCLETNEGIQVFNWVSINKYSDV